MKLYVVSVNPLHENIVIAIVNTDLSDTKRCIALVNVNKTYLQFHMLVYLSKGLRDLRSLISQKTS